MDMKAIFLGPPLWFDEVHTGYMYTGPFIGAVLGFLLAGLLADWSAKMMIRRNKGIYEPEFRIILVVRTFPSDNVLFETKAQVVRLFTGAEESLAQKICLINQAFGVEKHR